MRLTIKQVAKIAGVTPAIVSRIINNDESLSIREETRARVLKTIEELDYHPNAVARSLRLKKTNTIAMLVPDIMNPFAPEIIKGAQKAASENNYSLILCDTEDDVQKAKQYIEVLADKQTDGLLLASVLIEGETMDVVHKYRMPYVLVNRKTKNTGNAYVGANGFYGAGLAVKHLIELGHRKIAHISGFLYIDSGLERYNGYMDMLKKHNIDYIPQYVVASRFDEQSGYNAMKQILSLPDIPTAVFAADDEIALGAVAAITDHGLKVPDDISIVGYNDLLITRKITPPLTTVRVPLFDMGYLASELLINKIEKKPIECEKKLLECELIIRDSTTTLNP